LGGTHSVKENDFELAAAAIARERSGSVPTSPQAAARARVEAWYEKKAIDKLVANFPRAKFWELIKTTPQKAYGISKRYKLPLAADEPINLGDVFEWLFNILKSGEWVQAEENDALERCRETKAELLKIELATKQGQLVSAEHVRGIHAIIAQILRRCGETLERRHGEDAAEALREALGDAQAHVNEFLSEAHDFGEPSIDAED
jgi:hypothetical protein